MLLVQVNVSVLRDTVNEYYTTDGIYTGDENIPLANQAMTQKETSLHIDGLLFRAMKH